MFRVLYHRIYLAGYSGWEAPYWMRLMLARTELHKAWLSGFHGRFEEDGVMYGPANPYHPVEQEADEKAEWSEQLVRHGLPPG